MSKSLEPITIIASDLCEDIGDSNEFHHMRFQKKLLEAFRELNLYVSPELSVKTEIFPVDGQIELPCDFITETKVGLLRNGILVTLDIDRSLNYTKRKATDTQILSDMNACFDGTFAPDMGYPFYNSFRGGNYVGELYGFGCGYHANTWYNINDGVLQLSSIVPDDTEVVIEYKSNGLADGFKLIPSEMVMAAKFYAKARFYEDRQPGLAASFDEKYKMQYQRLKRLYNFRSPDYLAFLFKSSDRSMHL